MSSVRLAYCTAGLVDGEQKNTLGIAECRMLELEHSKNIIHLLMIRLARGGVAAKPCIHTELVDNIIR